MTKRELWNNTFNVVVVMRGPEVAAMMANRAVEACGDDPVPDSPEGLTDEEAWLRAYLTVLSSGAAHHKCAWAADDCLANYRELFRDATP